MTPSMRGALMAASCLAVGASMDSVTKAHGGQGRWNSCLMCYFASRAPCGHGPHSYCCECAEDEDVDDTTDTTDAIIDIDADSCMMCYFDSMDPCDSDPHFQRCCKCAQGTDEVHPTDIEDEDAKHKHILEVGEVIVGGSNETKPTTVKFKKQFAIPPVVVMLITARGGNPAAIRISNVTCTGFETVIAEAPGEDGPHVKMAVSFIAARPGKHELPDGRVFMAGFHETSSTVAGPKCQKSGFQSTWDTLAFQEAFSDPPALVTAIQTMNNEVRDPPTESSEPWLTVATTNITAAGAQLSLDQSETSKKGSVDKPETIGYIAMETGAGNFTLQDGTKVKYAAVLSGEIVEGWNNPTKSIAFGTDLNTSHPLVVGSMSSRNGNGGGWLRLVSVSPTQASVSIDEDKWCDSERKHIAEQASIIAWSAMVI